MRVAPSEHATLTSVDDGAEGLPHPASVPSTPQRSYVLDAVFGALSAIPYLGLLIIGLGAIVYGLALTVFLLLYLVYPCVQMYIAIVSETSAWKHWDSTKPCPQLWKDGLEDELWWF